MKRRTEIFNEELDISESDVETCEDLGKLSFWISELLIQIKYLERVISDWNKDESNIHKLLSKKNLTVILRNKARYRVIVLREQKQVGFNNVFIEVLRKEFSKKEFNLLKAVAETKYKEKYIKTN